MKSLMFILLLLSLMFGMYGMTIIFTLLFLGSVGFSIIRMMVKNLRNPYHGIRF